MAHQVIEVDPDLEYGDDESAYESGLESDTTSLSESVVNYVYENGRRFHGYRQGKYHLPNDEKEQDRMDLQSHMYQLAFQGSLHSAPIISPQSALDIGTGTGIYAIDFAEQFPECLVRGIDLSPIQPGWVPPNVVFEVDDIEEQWQYMPNSIDYVHIRDMSYSVRDWEHILSQTFKALRPGGWVEIQDWKDICQSDDGSVKPGSVLSQWRDICITTSKSLGFPYFDVVKNSKQMLAKRGFVDYGIVEKKLPLGPWPKDPKRKDLGRVTRAWATDTMDGALHAMLSKALGWDLEKSVKASKEAVDQMQDRSIHAYNIFAHCFARKPMDVGDEGRVKG